MQTNTKWLDEHCPDRLREACNGLTDDFLVDFAMKKEFCCKCPCMPVADINYVCSGCFARALVGRLKSNEVPDPDWNDS